MPIKQHMMLLIPLLVFVALAVFFMRRISLIEQGNSPETIPSVMINRPAPDFTLPSLMEGKPNVTMMGLKGHVTLVNIFASWCMPCRVEHTLLGKVKDAGIVLVGINYKDQPQNARKWLGDMGNPYDAVAMDKDGRTAIDFGAYGVPESYLLDKQGVIRFKQIGPLTVDDIQKKLLPVTRELLK